VHCGQTVGRIKTKLGRQVGLGPGHIVLDGDPALPNPEGHSPQFSAHISCGQMAPWIKTPLGMELGLCQGDFVLDGDPAALPQKGGGSGPCLLGPNGWMDQDDTWHEGIPQPRRLCVRWGRMQLPSAKRGQAPPQFTAHFYCDQTAGRIKVPLDTEVGLGPGDIVLMETQLHLPKRGRSPLPNFGPCLWPNSWMDQDSTRHGGGPWSRPHCARWGPSSPPPKRGQSPLQLLAHFIVAKQLDASRCHLVWR